MKLAARKLSHLASVKFQEEVLLTDGEIMCQTPCLSRTEVLPREHTGAELSVVNDT